MIRQLEGRYKVKNEGLRPLYEEARLLLKEFDEVDLLHIRREYNVDADALVNAASTRARAEPLPMVLWYLARRSWRCTRSSAAAASTTG